VRFALGWSVLYALMILAVVLIALLSFLFFR
jgi:hypothetical protein